MTTQTELDSKYQFGWKDPRKMSSLELMEGQIFAQAKRIAELEAELNYTEVLLEECKMDWSGDVTQLKAEHAHEVAGLRTAAQAVIDRWDSPAWKKAEATAVHINRLRESLK